MTYTVYYRKLPWPFWHKISNVEGDGILPENPEVRLVLCEDGTRYEIGAGHVVRFSRERFFAIQRRMEEESGQKIGAKLP